MIRKLGVFLFTVAAFCAADDRPPLAPEATEFRRWYESYHGSIMPPDVLKAYQKHMAKSGVNAEESQRRVAVVTGAIRAMPVEFTTLHFNKIYSSANPPFRQEPSHFVMRMTEDLKPGAALDVAMGHGRNAIYLASKGWTVTGYDLSDQGLRIAEGAAKKAGLTLQTIRATHEFDYGAARWDLIVETFAFTNLADAAYRKRLLDSLKPGGVLLIEGFGGGPKNEMLESFRDLRMIYYEDRDDIADWGVQRMRLTRLAVRKD